MPASTTINLHIDRVIIDEAVHRAGPDAVRAALAAQLPGLLAEHGGGAGLAGANRPPLSQSAANAIAARIPSNSTSANK